MCTHVCVRVCVCVCVALHLFTHPVINHHSEYLVFLCDGYHISSWLEFHFLHDTKDISLYTEGQVKTKVTDVMVQDPLWHRKNNIELQGNPWWTLESDSMQKRRACVFLHHITPYTTKNTDVPIIIFISCSMFEIYNDIHCINIWRPTG